jgi:hypothetical protein
MRLAAAPLALRHLGYPAGPVGWVTYATLAAFLVAYLAAAVWFFTWSARWWPPGDDDADEGGGGGGLRREPPSPIGPTDGDPAWWPEFERQFAAYVADRMSCVD